MNVKTVFTEIVAPLLGVIIATALFASPIPAVLRARRECNIGDLNPLPYVMITGNCVGWTVYCSYILKDPYVLCANLPGMMMGFWYTCSALPLTTQQRQDIMTACILVITFCLDIIGFLITKLNISQQQLQIIWGVSSSTVLVAYFVTPLSTMLQVIKTRNSASIYPPLALLTVCNGVMWLTYGLALSDPLLWVPNGIGVLLGILQLAVCLCFLRSRKQRSSSGPTLPWKHNKEESLSQRAALYQQTQPADTTRHYTDSDNAQQTIQMQHADNSENYVGQQGQGHQHQSSRSEPQGIKHVESTNSLSRLMCSKQSGLE